MSKKKHIVLSTALCLVAVLVALGWKYYPRALPLEECSEVYKRYKDVEGVRATYVKDYRVNDTLTVGVTLLEATTDSGWAVLQEDFGLPVIPKEKEATFCGDSNRVTIKNTPKSTPFFSNGDTLEDDIIAISRYKHTIGHFVIQSNEQRKLLLHKQYEENIKHDSLKYTDYEEKS